MASPLHGCITGTDLVSNIVPDNFDAAEGGDLFPPKSKAGCMGLMGGVCLGSSDLASNTVDVDIDTAVGGDVVLPKLNAG
mmetsp:Transcript_5833/g.11206  ORF Transcript_5833/g.11206 Transcript_5833/m.11206 type:complete len:80 (-) Transcript_5833:196-435(-)